MRRNNESPAAASTPPAGMRPNILALWGGDIGWFSVSADNMGIMAGRAPNIAIVELVKEHFAEHAGNEMRG